MAKDNKPIKLANGMRLSNGQLIQSTKNVARDGAEKRPHVPETTFGMKNRIAETTAAAALAGFHNPSPLDDSKLETKAFLDGRSAPPVVGHRSRTGSYDQGEGSQVLSDGVMPSRK
jgi:hypothetical protein